eukprot:UN08207
MHFRLTVTQSQFQKGRPLYFVLSRTRINDIFYRALPKQRNSLSG